MKQLNQYINENIFDMDDASLSKAKLSEINLQFSGDSKEAFKVIDIMDEERLKEILYHIQDEWNENPKTVKFIISADIRHHGEITINIYHKRKGYGHDHLADIEYCGDGVYSDADRDYKWSYYTTAKIKPKQNYTISKIIDELNEEFK